MSNGTFYTEVLCGPRGSEALPFAKWKANFPQSYVEFDVDIVQGFAGWMAKRSEEEGGAATAEGGQALMAANAWNLRDPALPHEEQAASFHFHMCKAMRESDAGAKDDETPHQRVTDSRTVSSATESTHISRNKTRNRHPWQV